MATNNSIEDKQYMAKILFTREKLDQKIVAKRVGVSEKTMSAWVTKFAWKKLRNRLLASKEEILNNLYEQLEELNNDIRTKNEGKRYGDTKQADIQIKLTASVRNLETELAIADLVESGIRFIKDLQIHGTHEQVMMFSELWHQFIQRSVKA
jgi:transposase